MQTAWSEVAVSRDVSLSHFLLALGSDIRSVGFISVAVHLLHQPTATGGRAGYVARDACSIRLALERIQLVIRERQECAKCFRLGTHRPPLPLAGTPPFFASSEPATEDRGREREREREEKKVASSRADARGQSVRGMRLRHLLQRDDGRIIPFCHLTSRCERCRPFWSWWTAASGIATHLVIVVVVACLALASVEPAVGRKATPSAASAVSLSASPISEHPYSCHRVKYPWISRLSPETPLDGPGQEYAAPHHHSQHPPVVSSMSTRRSPFHS